MKAFIFFFFSLILSPAVLAKVVRYELNIENRPLNLSGHKEVDFALTVNGSVPAPTLEFTEGDDAEITVRNKLKGEEVSIHWHGLLLPTEEDGVAYVNTPPIHPGQERVFKFKIRQNGTYWYHSHTALQEQKGVYGAFIIHPKKKSFQYDRDVVLVLSDWSDENPDQIMKNLRKDGDYYLYKKDTVRSYFEAYHLGKLRNQLINEWTRMGGMDLSDVGYDAFLLNGKREWFSPSLQAGEKVRVRVVNAAASSYFYLGMKSPLLVIAADGVDVEPFQAQEVLIGMAETYDFLFTVPAGKLSEFRAYAQDGTGQASAWLGNPQGERELAPPKEKPDLYALMDHSQHQGHSQHAGHQDHSGREKPAEHQTHEDRSGHGGAHEGHREHSQPVPHSTHQDHSPHQGHVMEQALSISWENQSDAMLKQNEAKRDLNPKGAAVALATVNDLKALQSTELPKSAKVHDIQLTLGGDMERYIWHLNGKSIHQDRLLLINKGEVVRFTFVNQTMMHHPMHLHGHFFRVLNQAQDKSPLKHTVDVPPHETRTIEFYANEPGQWMLHCHNLYHMKTGMARVVRYQDFPMSASQKKYDAEDPHLHDHTYTFSELEGATNHLRAQSRIMRTWDEIEVHFESADLDRSEGHISSRWETEGDILYRRWQSNFLNIFAGGSLYDEAAYGALGVSFILPLLFETSFSFNQKGQFRFDLEKRFQWTKTIYSDLELAWRPGWDGDRDLEYEISLMYRPEWNWSVGLMFTEIKAGLGAQYRF